MRKVCPAFLRGKVNPLHGWSAQDQPCEGFTMASFHVQLGVRPTDSMQYLLPLEWVNLWKNKAGRTSSPSRTGAELTGDLWE